MTTQLAPRFLRMVLALLASFALTQTACALTSQDLMLTLSLDRHKYEMDEDIMLNVSLENLMDLPLTTCCMLEPIDAGDALFSFDVKGPRGDRLKYMGIRRRISGIPKIQLGPKEAKTATLNLIEYYWLHEPGSYTVQAHYRHPLGLKEPECVGLITDTLASNTLEFTLTDTNRVFEKQLQHTRATEQGPTTETHRITVYRAEDHDAVYYKRFLNDEMTAPAHVVKLRKILVGSQPQMLLDSEGRVFILTQVAEQT